MDEPYQILNVSVNIKLNQ